MCQVCAPVGMTSPALANNLYCYSCHQKNLRTDRDNGTSTAVVTSLPQEQFQQNTSMESDGEGSTERQEQGHIDCGSHFAPTEIVPVKHIGGVS